LAAFEQWSKGNPLTEERLDHLTRLFEQQLDVMLNGERPTRLGFRALRFLAEQVLDVATLYWGPEYAGEIEFIRLRTKILAGFKAAMARMDESEMADLAMPLALRFLMDQAQASTTTPRQRGDAYGDKGKRAARWIREHRGELKEISGRAARARRVAEVTDCSVRAATESLKDEERPGGALDPNAA